ncbi:MAG: DUF177 domain-containing protein [Acidobacteriota bacterium]
MKIRLDQVDKPFDWQETLSLSSKQLDRAELISLGEIECRGRVSPMVEDFLLRATLSYDQELRCMRCLKPVMASVSTDIEFLLQIGSETVDEERELRTEELGVLTVSSPEFDTQPLLIEQIQLAVPMKPLCREDCAGLCTRCGADLNDSPCGCAAVADPRWAALGALRPGSSD